MLMLLDQTFFLRIAVFLFLLWAITNLVDLVLWVFLAFTLAAAVEPLVNWLSRRLSRAWAVTLAYLLVLGVFTIGFWVATPILSNQFARLLSLLRELPIQFDNSTGLDSLIRTLASSAQAASTFLFRIVGNVSEAMLALVLSVMISLEPHLVKRIAPFLPGEGWVEVLEATWQRMGYWARAQFLIAFSFALLFGTWLLVIGVPAPWALAVLGAVLEVVPFVGGALIATLSTIVALTAKGWIVAGLVLAGYGAIALLEGKLLIPIIYGRTLGYHPATVLLAIFVGGKLFGILGVFLAVPGFILVENIYRSWVSKRQA